MKDRRLTVELTEAEARALLRALPRCIGCGGLAEVELGGRLRCAACAVPVRKGRCIQLSHAALALRIEDLVSPFQPHPPKPRKRGTK